MVARWLHTHPSQNDSPLCIKAPAIKHNNTFHHLQVHSAALSLSGLPRQHCCGDSRTVVGGDHDVTAHTQKKEQVAMATRSARGTERPREKCRAAETVRLSKAMCAN